MGGEIILDDAKEFIDVATFEQILEMDDDEGRDFSKTIVFEFFTQAETTFKEMDGRIATKDLASLSSLGHFLKGSSATLGLIKIKEACEAIQHLGASLDESGTKELPDAQESLSRIRKKLDRMKSDYEQVKKYLLKLYRD